MTTMPVDLRAEAAAEVRRLTSARAFARDSDEGAVAELEGNGPWITRARRPVLRRFLGRRLMLIWREVYEDACGGRSGRRERWSASLSGERWRPTSGGMAHHAASRDRLRGSRANRRGRPRVAGN